MSRLGKKPIEMPEGVEVKMADSALQFKGPKGELSFNMLPLLEPKLEDGQLSFTPTEEGKQARANWGTMVAICKNAVAGVRDGFSKTLLIEGVGYRVKLEGNDLVLNVGFSHPVNFKSPEGVTISVEKNSIKIEGINKQLVGETAAKIRKIKKPEPYKGKGIRYEGEIIRRKSGKKAVGSG